RGSRRTSRRSRRSWRRATRMVTRHAAPLACACRRTFPPRPRGSFARRTSTARSSCPRSPRAPRCSHGRTRWSARSWREASRPARVVLLEDAGEARSGDLAELRADVLDRRHERECQEGGPERREAERRTSHGVRPDAAWVIVRGSRDETRAEEESRLLDRLLLLGELLRPAHVAMRRG